MPGKERLKHEVAAERDQINRLKKENEALNSQVANRDQTIGKLMRERDEALTKCAEIESARIVLVDVVKERNSVVDGIARELKLERRISDSRKQRIDEMTVHVGRLEAEGTFARIWRKLMGRAIDA